MNVAELSEFGPRAETGLGESGDFGAANRHRFTHLLAAIESSQPLAQLFREPFTFRLSE